MILEFLFGAWFLSWFGFDDILIEVFQPMTNMELTTSHYYVAFVLLGLLAYVFKKSDKIIIYKEKENVGDETRSSVRARNIKRR